jgi:hypothetical protein
MSQDHQPSAARSAAIRAAARDTLLDAMTWSLPPAGWAKLDQRLAAIEKALARGEDEELGAEVGEVILLGPRRIIRIGALPVPAVPAQTHERLVRLVHVLSTAKAPGTDDPAASVLRP